MDNITTSYYNDNSEILQERYNNCSPDYINSFLRYYDSGSTVLDIGCGSGRDLNILVNLGFDAYGLEPSRNMINCSIDNYKAIDKRVYLGTVPDDLPLDISSKIWDNILIAAVLQHIPDSELFSTLFAVHRLLKSDGTLILSIPTNYPNIKNNRDVNNRLFIIRSKDEVLLLLERIGFTLIDEKVSDDALNRDDTSWTTLVLKKKYIDGIRPIDTIESIIREDKKVTTYKFGLLRALGELSSSPRKQVTWDSNGFVKLPIELVVDKWIEYYWPLMADENFIYQGQRIKDKQDIKFRTSLTKLVNYWEFKADGYLKFENSNRKGLFSLEEQTLYSEVKKQIKSAVITGPVKHMGNIKTGQILFSKDNCINVPGELWREFSLMGRWFEDSIIMRWAEVTAQYKFQSQGINKAYILGKLLQISDLKRSTNYTKNIFDSMENKRCVWSDIKLENKYAIDHAIPYSIWKNNASWNLFPTDNRVNGNKSDKLPTKLFLHSRKNRIFEYWDKIYEKEKSLFQKDLTNITPRITYSNKTRDEIFNYFSEHMEMLALRNSVERWEI